MTAWINWFRSVGMIAAVLFATVSLRCQPTQNVRIQPDCIMPFYLTAVGTVQLPDNSGTACGSWTLEYTANGFTGLSLRLDSAPDVSNAHGTFVSWAGTLQPTSGTNPQTSLTGSGSTPILALGYFRWVQVNLVSKTGTGYVTGTLLGYKVGGSGGGGSGGGGCPTAGTPCVIGAEGSSGIITDTACDLNGPVTISGSGTIQLIAPSAGKTVRVCHLDTLLSAGSTLQLLQGTGATCGTGSANIGGQYPSNILGIAEDYGTHSPLTLTISKGLCLTVGSAVTGGGIVTYAQY